VIVAPHLILDFSSFAMRRSWVRIPSRPPKFICLRSLSETSDPSELAGCALTRFSERVDCGALRRDPRVTVMLEHFPRDVSGDLHDRLIARAAFRNVSLSTSSAEFESSQMAKSPPRPIAFEPVETARMQPPDWFSNTSAWERSSLSLKLSRNRFLKPHT
jgi:hypothetical protein